MTIPLVGLADQYRELQDVAFSRSGKHAAIIVDDFKKMLLVDTGADQWTVTNTVPAGFHYVSGPAWLDDDRLIFAGTRQPQTASHLWRLDTATAQVTAVPAGSLSIRDFVSIAPGAHTLVACAYGGGELAWSLWTVDLASGETRRLTFGIEDVEPSWGPRPPF